jgi:hypothetical protein
LFSVRIDLEARKSSLGIGYAASGLVFASVRGGELRAVLDAGTAPALVPPTPTDARVTGGCSTVLVKRSEVQKTSLFR